MMRYFYSLLILLCFHSFSFPQSIHVELKQRTPLDSDYFHITPFYAQPKEELKLPSDMNSPVQFFDIFYSWDIEDDEIISVMVTKTDTSDILYIDTNNDEDLTNDDSPYIFPHKENEFLFEIVSRDDPKQIVKMMLLRKPIFINKAIPDTAIFEENGDLKRRIYFMVKTRAPNFEGKKGTFYIEKRVTLSRGQMNISNNSFQIGLFDMSNNGLYNDSTGKFEDLLMIDLNGDNLLHLSSQSEIFALNDVFQINEENYYLTDIDPYGNFFEMEKTTKSPTFYYLQKIQKLQESSSHLNMNKIEIDSSFWNTTFITLDGESIIPQKFKGKYILLNFWGEWCKPCIHEIPELVYVYDKIPKEKFEIFSFLRSNNLKLAKRIIQDKKMTWHHIQFDDRLEKHFKIKGYPTNIFISPEGNILFNENMINRTIFRRYFKSLYKP